MIQCILWCYLITGKDYQLNSYESKNYESYMYMILLEIIFIYCKSCLHRLRITHYLRPLRMWQNSVKDNNHIIFVCLLKLYGLMYLSSGW